MRPFRHVRARTVEEACALLVEPGARARANAGGTDLLGALKDGIYPEPPDVVVDLKSIPGLDAIEAEDAELRVGALARLADIARSESVRTRWPIFAQAAQAVASPQIRNMATLGGNLCQEVRCWYFRYPAGLGGSIDCLRKGGPRCPAVKGDTRYHAIFEGRGCFAVCPSDTAVALAALDAAAVIEGPGGRRELPVQDLYTPLGTVLEPGEILTAVRVPPPDDGSQSVFLKFTVREPIDFAVVSVAASITLQEGACTDARLVLGAVGPRPYRALEAEARLIGAPVDDQAAAEAAEEAVAGAKPLRGNAYKVPLIRSLVGRAILAAVEG
ncbi:MAG: FAD binding domain-containing protein [Actinobacteria bacterium]|nr:FAD binding domain-containing protein [Actinomycetota bacterium]